MPPVPRATGHLTGRSITVEGIREARARIDATGTRAQRPEPALRSTGTLSDLLASERRTFAVSGPGWRRLTPAWVAEKHRRGLDPRILRATGSLERALTTAAGARGITFRAYNGTLYWGIPRGRSYLYYAQPLARTRAGRRGRRMVKIDREATGHIALRVQRYIADGGTV